MHPNAEQAADLVRDYRSFILLQGVGLLPCSARFHDILLHGAIAIALKQCWVGNNYKIAEMSPIGISILSWLCSTI